MELDMPIRFAASLSNSIEQTIPRRFAQLSFSQRKPVNQGPAISRLLNVCGKSRFRRANDRLFGSRNIKNSWQAENSLIVDRLNNTA